jgi:hypothetical protein
LGGGCRYCFFLEVANCLNSNGEPRQIVVDSLQKKVFLRLDFSGALSTVEGSGFPWKSVWRTKSLPRAAFFVWSAAIGKILTLDNLRKR